MTSSLAPVEPQVEANAGYQQLWLGNSAAAVGRFEQALRDDPAFPYRWSDLGDALLAAGDVDRARACFRRALELGPRDPQIALRTANFHFRAGEPDETLKLDAVVLRQVPDYDDMIFSSCVRMGGALSRILDLAIDSNPRAAGEFFHFLGRQGGHGSEESLSIAWKWMDARGFITRPLAVSRTTALLDHNRPEEAAAIWAKYVSPRRDSLVENPSFEHPWLNEGFDWRLAPVNGASVTTDSAVAHAGRSSLKIRFDAVDNLDFHHVSQIVWLNPGRYRLTAWIRTEALSTDQGVGLRIAGAATPMLTGTHDWTRLSAEFVISGKPALERIEIVRRPSLKFDNHPHGTVWIDDVEVKPAI